MPTEKSGFDLLGMAYPVSFAILGGIVALINGDRRNFSPFYFVIGIVTSAFVGILAYSIVSEWDISNGYKAAAIGISGYCSHEVLKLGRTILFNYIKKRLCVGGNDGNTSS